MPRNYIKPCRPSEVPPKTIARVLVDPVWDDLRVALQEIQKGCRINRIPESRLKRLYEQARQPDFFSAHIMTAAEAPPDYGFPYYSTQAAACWLGDVTGFYVSRTYTLPGCDVDYPVYSLTPNELEFKFANWSKSMLSVFGRRLTDPQLAEVRGEKYVPPPVLTEEQKQEAEHNRLLREQARREGIRNRITGKRVPLTQEQRTIRSQQRAHRQLSRLIAQAQREEALQGPPVLEHEQNESELIKALQKGVEPTFCSLWQDGCEEITAALKAEGQTAISWKAFQERWPPLTAHYKRHIIQQVNKGLINITSLPEVDFDPMFTLSIGYWSGSQRIFSDKPQLVFRMDSERLFMSLSNENLETRKAVNEALLRANCFHPVGDWTVGWLRVHVDEANRLAFVDEVQSDAIESIISSYNPSKYVRQYLVRQLARQVQKDRSTYLPSEHRGYPDRKRPQIKLVNKPDARRVERMLAPWNLHGFATVKHWAHAIGFRAAMHSRDSAQQKPGMSPSERKWNTYYAPIIKQFKLMAEPVPGYPAPIMVEVSR